MRTVAKHEPSKKWLVCMEQEPVSHWDVIGFLIGNAGIGLTMLRDRMGYRDARERRAYNAFAWFCALSASWFAFR